MSSITLSTAETSKDSLPTLADTNERFRTIRELGSGTYGRVMLAFDRDIQQRCALKILQKSTTKYRDFQREYNYSLVLTPHRSIINTSEDRCFQTADAYVIVQEYAPLGDLFESIPPQRGLPERAVKTIMKQVASALEFMHDKGLVRSLARREPSFFAARKDKCATPIDCITSRILASVSKE